MQRVFLLGSVASLLACSAPSDSGSVSLAEPDWPTGMQASAVQTCTAPLEAPAWDEVGAALGLPAGPDPDAEHDDGGGLVAHDLDADGHLDLVLSWSHAPPRVAWGGPDGFVLEETSLGADTTQPSLVDLDEDGDFDVLFGSRSQTLQGLLVDGRTLVPADVGSQHPGVYLRELEPGDLDGDGRDELFVSYLGDPSHLARLDNGVLVPEPRLPDPWSRGPAFDTLWFDHQGDGDLDVYVVNDYPSGESGNRLWQNDGGVLTSVSSETQTDVGINGMGADAADLNGDGLDDLVAVGAPFVSILLQQPDREAYVDVSQAWGFALQGPPSTMAWAVLILDHDNDGDRDVLVTHGDLFDPAEPDRTEPLPITLYEREADRLAPVEVGLSAEGSWRAAVAVHLNDDGILDFVVQDVVDRPHVYRSTGCTGQGWLTVTAPNGTRVELEDEMGRVHVDTVRTGSSYGGATTPFVHFGLGAAERVQALTLTLTSGQTVTVGDAFVAQRHLQFQP